MSIPGRPRRWQRLVAAVLMVLTQTPGLPVAAAEVLEVQLDSLRVPINLAQLETWSQKRKRADAASSGEGSSDVAIWLSLLDRESQDDLRHLLHAPLMRDQGFGRQLLDSWAGSQLLAEVGLLLTGPGGQSTTPLLQKTLRRLLEERREVSLLELLRALPEPRLELQLDGLLGLAQQWRVQLERQRQALRLVGRLAQLPARLPDNAGATTGTGGIGPGAGKSRAVRLTLPVAGRQAPLPLTIWNPPAAPNPGPRRPWLLVMPGLGGTAEQLGWLAADLAEGGWPVVVLQHPGSDAAAVKATLEGLRPPPGAETLRQRLADLQAVVRAEELGQLPLGRVGWKPEGVVLIGHSLGGVAALLGAGQAPEAGLERRCRRFLNRLPVTNPSLLLQCQLPGQALPVATSPPEGLRGVVIYNSFGSLIWPEKGLRNLPVPVLIVGGSLDLVTPPIAEQLDLFLPVGDSRSRLVLVDGGSHFSPVRVSAREQALLQLGSDLVGARPESVQALLLKVTRAFLESVEPPPAQALEPQRLEVDGVRAYVMDGSAAEAWRRSLAP